MKLSLRLRTFSSHATVMYAKGTDYSILEVGLFHFRGPDVHVALRRPSHERAQPSVPGPASPASQPAAAVTGSQGEALRCERLQECGSGYFSTSRQTEGRFPNIPARVRPSAAAAVCIPDLRGGAALLSGSSSGRRLKLINHHQLISLRYIKMDDWSHLCLGDERTKTDVLSFPSRSSTGGCSTSSTAAAGRAWCRCTARR